MYRKVFKKFLKNKILNYQIIDKAFIDIVLDVLPGKHSSLHKNAIDIKRFNTYNIFIYFFKLLFLIIKLFIVKPHRNFRLSKKEYDYLILVPNIKFKDYYNLLANRLTGKYLVISLTDIKIKEYINIKKYFPNRLNIATAYSICLITYSLHALRQKREFGLLMNNIEIVQKLIFNILILQHFFEEYSFKKFLSLLPNIDHHYIIETYFSNNFQKTYAVRPTTTSYSEHHKYIKTQNLFYKSLLEKKIYKHLVLDKNIILLPSSLMIEVDDSLLRTSYPRRPKRILFLDTCLTKINEFNWGRVEAIRDFYNCLYNKIEIELFHKFHPALNTKNRKEIKRKYRRVHFIDDTNTCYLDKIDLIVGFYSTVFQTAILHKIPIILLANNYNYFDSSNLLIYNDLEKSPIIKINHVIEMKNMLSKLLSSEMPYYEELYTNLLHKYYTSLYNYPRGLEQMLKILNGN